MRQTDSDKHIHSAFKRQTVTNRYIQHSRNRQRQSDAAKRQTDSDKQIHLAFKKQAETIRRSQETDRYK